MTGQDPTNGGGEKQPVEGENPHRGHAGPRRAAEQSQPEPERPVPETERQGSSPGHQGVGGDESGHQAEGARDEG